MPRIPNGFPLDGEAHKLPSLPVWRASASWEENTDSLWARMPNLTRKLDRAICAQTPKDKD